MGPAPFNEVQLKITEDLDLKTELVGRRMLPVRGYAKRVFSSLPERANSFVCLSPGAQRDLSHSAMAFSITVASILYDRFHVDIENDLKQKQNFLAFNPNLVWGAGRIVLDEFFDLQHVQHLVKVFVSHDLDRMPMPPSIQPSNGQDLPEPEWDRIWRSVSNLSHAILALSALGNPEALEELFISDALLHAQFEFEFQVSIGQMRGRNVIDKNHWYDAVSRLMQGKRSESVGDWTLRERKSQIPFVILSQSIKDHCRTLMRQVRT